jgi:hypothetical protein
VNDLWKRVKLEEGESVDWDLVEILIGNWLQITSLSSLWNINLFLFSLKHHIRCEFLHLQSTAIVNKSFYDRANFRLDFAFIFIAEPNSNVLNHSDDSPEFHLNVSARLWSKNDSKKSLYLLTTSTCKHTWSTTFGFYRRNQKYLDNVCTSVSLDELSTSFSLNCLWSRSFD